MILTDVRRRLRRGPASAQLLAVELGSDPAMVDAAIAYWRNRGAIRVCRPDAPAPGACGICGACPAGHTVVRAPAVDVYEWCDATESDIVGS